LVLLRIVLGAVGHVFFAMLWGYVLGHRGKLHWFGVIWLIATIFHALFDHIVFGRGAGTLVFGVLLAVFMLFAGAWLLKQAQRVHVEVQLSSSIGALDRLSLSDVAQALYPRNQPLMLTWIVIGTFVNTGVVITTLLSAIYLGHQLGVDFAAADEADMRANGPLVLLGSALLVAFPIAGYLVARASGARGVLEPAMGAAGAIAVVVALLSMTAPVAVVFVLAVAPVAFGLACAGAWFGLIR
jgi:hypothetical protein